MLAVVPPSRGNTYQLPRPPIHQWASEFHLPCIALALLVTAFFGGQALLPSLGTLSSSANRPIVAATAAIPNTSVNWTHRPIEAVRVGDRVLTNASASAVARTAVDSGTWRRLKLAAEAQLPDGTLDILDIETLQSQEWVDRHDAQIGVTVPIPLDLREMGLPEQLTAVVVGNEACPPLEAGPGRYVLATVAHLSSQVYELALRSPEGLEETLRPTGWHLFYSEQRQDWVAARDLRPNEPIKGVAGRLFVAAVRPLTGIQTVYNMTVEGDHVFHVSLLGALAHNNGNDPCKITIDGSKHPESARHAQDAIDNGVNPDGVVDRTGAKPRREGRLEDEPRVPGMDRDEFPPAVLDNGNGGNSVRPIAPGDNRGAGASIGNQLRGVPDGTPVIITPINVPPKKR
jgi:hypothetical protein